MLLRTAAHQALDPGPDEISDPVHVLILIAAAARAACTDFGKRFAEPHRLLYDDHSRFSIPYAFCNAIDDGGTYDHAVGEAGDSAGLFWRLDAETDRARKYGFASSGALTADRRSPSA